MLAVSTHEPNGVCLTSEITSPQRTPRVLKIAVTEPTPQLSMSRRRLERNIPVLQCQLAIPPPMFFAKQPSALQSPSSPSPTGSLYSFSVSHRPSFPTGQACSPITPIDQILHTPLSPPKLPRLVPPAPRTWARLNMEARWGETSPLESPGLPLTPYVLNSTDKPSLKPLQIPGTMLAGDPGLRERRLSPSPQAVSPFEVSGIVPAFPRPSAVRTSSSSHLARAALLRTARPGFARSFSMNGRPIGAGDLEGLSPVPLPFAAQPSSPSSMARPLASPFAIRPDAFDGEYFARV